MDLMYTLNSASYSSKSYAIQNGDSQKWDAVGRALKKHGGLVIQKDKAGRTNKSLRDKLHTL